LDFSDYDAERVAAAIGEDLAVEGADVSPAGEPP
jgi:hypothetical protein